MLDALFISNILIQNSAIYGNFAPRKIYFKDIQVLLVIGTENTRDLND